MRTLKSWGSRYGKTTGIFNPKIAAITALGISLATQGWGSALATSIGLTGASSAAFTAGISSVAAQGGLSLMRNNLDPLATLKDVTRKDALLSTLESMAVGGALSGVTQAQTLSGHVTKAAVKAAVHAGFQGVQGQPVNIQNIFKDVAVNTLSGVAANTIGDAYGSGGIDPVTHKVLHGVVGGAAGGILNGSQGATSGALSAMIAETLADLVTPQAEHIRDTLFQSGCDDPLKAYNDYLTTQKNLLVLTTASIMAGLGKDVDTAINAADNALSHNAVQLAMAAATIAWEIYALTHEAEVELARDAVIDIVAEKTGFSKATVSKTFDGLILTAGLIQPAKGGVKALAKVTVKGARGAVKEAPKPTTMKEGTKRNDAPLKEDHLFEDHEWKKKIIGKGQKTGTDGHAFRSYREAIREAKKPDTEKVFLDRGINRAAEHPIKPNRRPDVTVLKKDGKINQIEVPSKSDKDHLLMKRMEDTNKRLPAHQRGEFDIKHIKKEIT